MNNDELKRIADNLWWIAVWLFCLFVTQCGNENVTITINEPKQADYEDGRTVSEWLDDLYIWRESLGKEE